MPIIWEPGKSSSGFGIYQAGEMLHAISPCCKDLLQYGSEVYTCTTCEDRYFAIPNSTTTEGNSWDTKIMIDGAGLNMKYLQAWIADFLGEAHTCVSVEVS